MQKKKHHYVPVTYLKGFTDLGGRIFACRKDEPENQLHLKPDGIAFERYYYSQPVPSGGQDNNTIEDLFGKTEAHWPGILERIRARQDLMSSYEHLANFLGLMRVRGPAARDVVETYLAAGVAQVGKQLKEQGKLPPAPESFPDIADHIEISIDPHQSLHAIPPQLQGFAELVDQLEYQVLHDATGIGVITSDNPVVYFDPALPSHRLIPYPRRLSTRSMELYFPLSANAVLRGRTVVGGAR